jgi:nucleoside 2-deoxyribosyltransferase
MNTIRPLQNLKRVYCAGPLFSQAERREMEEIAATLRAAGFDTFVPHADGLEFSDVVPSLVERGMATADAGALLHEAIFALDVYQVVIGCGSLVFNMNGRVPDEGSVSEAAIAWTLGKPIVLYKDDARSAIAGRDNPLVAGLSEFQTIDKLEELGAALSRQIARCPLSSNWETGCPPHLETVLASGADFWRLIESYESTPPATDVADAVLALFGPSAVS